MSAATRSRVASLGFRGSPDKLASKNWSRLAIYADRGIIVLNKPPYLVCQGSDVQDGQVGAHSLVCDRSLSRFPIQDQKPRERNVDKFNDLLSGECPSSGDEPPASLSW